MKTLDELLVESSARHRHLCPRQVLGVQMGRLAADLLGLDLPQDDKRLLTIVETDGCFTTGLSVATNCWVGRRTMRVEDYGKVAATFVDTQTEQAIRIAPSPARAATGRRLRTGGAQPLAGDAAGLPKDARLPICLSGAPSP